MYPIGINTPQSLSVYDAGTWAVLGALVMLFFMALVSNKSLIQMIIHFIIPLKSQTLNLSFTAPPNQLWACRLQSQKAHFTGISTFIFIIDDNECKCKGGHTHGEIRAQLCRFSSLLLLCGFQGLNSDHLVRIASTFTDHLSSPYFYL